MQMAPFLATPGILAKSALCVAPKKKGAVFCSLASWRTLCICPLFCFACFTHCCLFFPFWRGPGCWAACTWRTSHCFVQLPSFQRGIECPSSSAMGISSIPLFVHLVSSRSSHLDCKVLSKAHSQVPDSTEAKDLCETFGSIGSVASRHTWAAMGGRLSPRQWRQLLVLSISSGCFKSCFSGLSIVIRCYKWIWVVTLLHMMIHGNLRHINGYNDIHNRYQWISNPFTVLDRLSGDDGRGKGKGPPWAQDLDGYGGFHSHGGTPK